MVGGGDPAPSYMAMLAPPASLAAVEPRAREIYVTGWRPPVPEGPTRDELTELVTTAAPRPQQLTNGEQDGERPAVLQPSFLQPTKIMTQHCHSPLRRPAVVLPSLHSGVGLSML